MDRVTEIAQALWRIFLLLQVVRAYVSALIRLGPKDRPDDAEEAAYRIDWGFFRAVLWLLVNVFLLWISK